MKRQHSARQLDARRATVLLATVVLVMGQASVASASCSGDSLVSPATQGQNNDSLLGNFYTLMADLTHSPADSSDQHAVHRLTIDGELHVTAPWFTSSTECTEGALNDGGSLHPNPTLQDYLVVSDELSELALLVSLWTDDDLMMGIHRTAQAMTSDDYPGLPCWIARVREDSTPPTLECLSEDTASDGTVRLGLAYYHAANNPHFPEPSRTLYRERADAIAHAHLDAEFAHGQTFHSALTGRAMDDWIGGGGNTAQTLDGLQMWTGYHQDVTLFLLAAYAATGDDTFLARAEDVVDQWLMANEFDGSNLSFGAKNFGWDTSSDPLLPIRGAAWDESDAARSLWMGHVLRARNLATGGSALPTTYAYLSDWVQLLLATDTQSDRESCIEYQPDGSVPTDGSGDRINCGDNYYYNGLGMGLLTYHNTSWLPTKLQLTLTKYAWGEARKYWDWTSCFGIYRGVRPAKALASALGLDAATYGGERPGACELDVTRTGTGTGYVLSMREGIDCGVDCSGLFVEDETVTLTPQAYEGSTFDGWSEPVCSSGSITLTGDTTCTASFSGSCDPQLVLTAQTITTDRLFAGCGEIVAGNGFEIASGTTTLRAGERTVLKDGFSVADGASLVVHGGAEP